MSCSPPPALTGVWNAHEIPPPPSLLITGQGWRAVSGEAPENGPPSPIAIVSATPCRYIYFPQIRATRPGSCLLRAEQEEADMLWAGISFFSPTKSRRPARDERRCSDPQAEKKESWPCSANIYLYWAGDNAGRLNRQRRRNMGNLIAAVSRGGGGGGGAWVARASMFILACLLAHAWRSRGREGER